MKSYTGVVSRYIKNEKRSVIPVFISIVLTICAITSVSFIAQNIMRNKFEEKKIEFGDYDVRLQKINSERLEKIKSHENIKDYAIGKSDRVVHSVNSMGTESTAYQFPIEEYAVEKKFFDEYINFKVVEGRLPTSEKEIVLDSSILTFLARDTKIGDTIEVTKIDGDISEVYIDKDAEIKGEIVNYKIVGIIETNPDDILFGNKIVRLLSKEEIEKSEEVEVFTYLNDSLKVEELANDLGLLYILPNSNMNDYPFGYPSSDIKYPGYEKYEYTNLIKNAFAMSIIAVISLFCLMAVYNTFHAAIAKKIRVYGILRAVGGSMKQITYLICLESLILYVVAAPIGLLIGYGLTKLESYILVEKAGILEKFTMKVDLEVILITLVATFAMILFSIISILIKEGKLTPIEAIIDARGLGRKKKSLGTNIVGMSLSGSGSDEDEREAVKEILNYEKKTFKFKIMKKLFKFEGQIAHKNITIDSDAYKLSKRTLFVAMAILVFFYVQVVNANVDIKDIVKSKNWDIELSLNGNNFENEVIENMKDVKGVEEVYRVASEQVSLVVSNEIISSELNTILDGQETLDIDGRKYKRVKAEIMTLDENSIKLYEGVDKEALNNGGVLLVNKATNAKIIGAGSDGPIYTYISSENVLSAKETDKLLLGEKNLVVENGYFEEKYNENIKVNELNIVGNVEDDVLYSTFKSTNGEELTSNIKLLTTEEGLNKIVEPSLNNKLVVKTINNDERVNTVSELKKISANNNYELKDIYKNKLKLERNLYESMGLNIIFAITIVIMVVLNLVNTTNAVILSRRKELAGMRAIGMSNAQQRKMIIAEVFYISLTVAIAVILSAGVFSIVNLGVDISAGKVNLVQVLIVEGLIILSLMIVSNLTSLAPLIKASKFNIVEDLKDE